MAPILGRLSRRTAEGINTTVGLSPNFGVRRLQEALDSLAIDFHRDLRFQGRGGVEPRLSVGRKVKVKMQSTWEQSLPAVPRCKRLPREVIRGRPKSSHFRSYP